MRGTKAKRLRRLRHSFIEAGMTPPRKVRRLVAWIDRNRGQVVRRG